MNTHIAAAHRRKGLAGYIKRLAEQTAREAGAVFLYTRCAKHNTLMLTLNEKLGYEAVPEEGTYMRLRKKLAPDSW